MNEQPMDLNQLLIRASLTLGLGLIIGFQREWKESSLAGIRTFPLIALTGFFCSVLEKGGIQWAVAGGLISLSVLLGTILYRHSTPTSGITTEVAAVFTYLIGSALGFIEEIQLVVVAGGVCAILLHLKEKMHGMVESLNRTQVQNIMQFVLIAIVILPLLPDKSYDAFQVLNPRKIWLMVVLITGISVISFAVQKIKKGNSGTFLTGVLGGLISSTATTVTLSRLGALRPSQISLVPAIMIASTIAFVRVGMEIFIVSPSTFPFVALPLGILFVFMILLSGISFYRSKDEMIEVTDEDQGSSQLKAALVFGGLFAAILYLTAWARLNFGNEGLYVVSLISGLIDVDAITLSTTQLMKNETLSTDIGWKLILTAFLSNLVFKGVMVAAIAKGAVRRQVTFYFSLSVLAGIAVLLIL